MSKKTCKQQIRFIYVKNKAGVLMRVPEGSVTNHEKLKPII